MSEPTSDPDGKPATAEEDKPADQAEKPCEPVRTEPPSPTPESQPHDGPTEQPGGAEDVPPEPTPKNVVAEIDEPPQTAASAVDVCESTGGQRGQQQGAEEAKGEPSPSPGTGSPPVAPRDDGTPPIAEGPPEVAEASAAAPVDVTEAGHPEAPSAAGEPEPAVLQPSDGCTQQEPISPAEGQTDEKQAAPENGSGALATSPPDAEDDATFAAIHHSRERQEPIRLPYNMQNVRGTTLLPDDGSCQSPVYDRLTVDSKFWAAVASILAVKGKELQEATAPLTSTNVAKLAAKNRRQHEVFTAHVHGVPGSSHLSSAALSIILEEQGVPCSERLAGALIRRVAHGQQRLNEAQFVTLMTAVHGAILRRVAAADLKHGAPAPGTTLSVALGEASRSRSRSRSPGAGLFTPPMSVSEGRQRRSLSPRSGMSSFSVSYTPETVTSKHREHNAVPHPHPHRNIESRSRPWREPLVSPVVKLVHDRMMRRARSPPPTLGGHAHLTKDALSRNSRSPRASEDRSKSPVQVKNHRTQLRP